MLVIFGLLPLSTLGVSGGGQLPAPEVFLIDNWQSEDGLPQDRVSSIVQTRDGFIWVGTDLGLARFDGLRFTSFSGITHQGLFRLSRVSKLFEAGDGTLLIAGRRAELAAFRDGKFELLSPSSKDSRRGQYVGFLNTKAGGTIIAEEGWGLWRWDDGRLQALCTNSGIRNLVSNGFAEDERGRIWFIQRGGNLYRFSDGKLEAVILPAELGGEACQVLKRDAAGRLWLGTLAGLAVLKAGQFERVNLSGINQPYEIHDLLCASDGGLWIQHGKTFRKFKDDQWVTDPVELKKLGSPSFLAEDRWGRLCVITASDGLIRIAEDGMIVKMDPNSGLPGNSLICRLEDREGNEWFGTERTGLLRIRPRVFASLFPPSGESIFPRSVCEDHAGGIWIGAFDQGLFHNVGTNWSHYADMTDNSRMAITSVLEDSRSNLWVGAIGGLFRFHEGRFEEAVEGFEPIINVMNLFEDSSGRIWFGCNSGLFVLDQGKLTNVRPLGEDLGFNMGGADVRIVVEDRQGRIWVGTGGSGLLCLEGGQWKAYSSKDGLAGNFVMTLFCDAEGELWISTYGSGLSRLHGGKFSNYNTQNGLADNFITHITEDRNGWLWMASSQKGAFRVARHEFDEVERGEISNVTSITYNRSDGLLSMDCSWINQPAGCSTRDGRLLLPTLKGVVVARPEAVDPNLQPPPVFIEATAINGRLATLAGKGESSLVVPPGSVSLEISYNALCYSAPEKIRFRHLLSNLESAWIECGGTRAVQYFHLPPGKYQFRVTACNNDGVWNADGAKLNITVEPYLWQTWTFRTMLLLLSLGAVVSVVWQIGRVRSQRRIRHLQQEQAVEQERARIARDMHDELGSRLTQASLITESVARGISQDAASRQRLTTLADTIKRMTLSMDELVWAVSPKHDTLDGLANYLVRYTQEFLGGTTLGCQLYVPAELPHREIKSSVRHNLFLAFKEALRNCVRHAQAGRVRVSLHFDGKMVRLEVVDDGQGFAPGSVGNLARGLQNMRDRLEIIGGTCQVESAEGMGARVIFEVKLEK